MPASCIRHSFTSRTIIPAVLVALVLALPATSEPLLVEKALPADSAVAVILRDGSAIQDEFRTTALYEVLQDPEMREMLKPLEQTLSNLYNQGKAMSPVPFEPLKELFSGELGVGVFINTNALGIAPVIQIIAKPADVAKAEQSVLQIMSTIMMFSNIEVPPKEGDTTRVIKRDGSGFAVTTRNGVLVVTLWNGAMPEGDWHEKALARIDGAAGGLAEDAEYTLVRKQIDDGFLGWAYVGLPALERSMPDMPIAPMLGTVGMQETRGLIAGLKIEDRGFRSRAFIHMPPQPGTPPRQFSPMIVPADLAFVPMDSVSFGIGSMDLPATYDQLLALAMMLDRRGELAKTIADLEQRLGLSIRNDVLGIFGNRYMVFVPEPGSEAQGQTLFLSIDDRKVTEEKLTRALNAIVDAIRQEAGAKADGFVRIDSIDRGNFAQIYPESVIPGCWTPNFTATDGWVGMGFSARSTLSTTRHLLQHERDITQRPDFARMIVKMPKEYQTIAYTDVGACFENLLATAQLLSDLGTGALKLAAVSGEFPLPVQPDSIWGMDSGRFPSQVMLREKLFGAITVIAHRPDGTLIENFSPVGPLPVPPRDVTGFKGSGLATTSILAGMLLPALARAREEARRASCANNLNQIAKAIVTYQEPHGESLPDSLQALVPDYVTDARVFRCPSTNRTPPNYAYVGGIPGNMVMALTPNVIIAYDIRGNHPRGRNALYLDGHVAWLTEGVFREKLQTSFEVVIKAYTKLAVDMPESVENFYRETAPNP
jgi:prepilin-type processing-associated H-X9-DG protein